MGDEDSWYICAFVEIEVTSFTISTLAIFTEASKIKIIVVLAAVP